MIYPNSYDNRIWMSTSMEGCNIYSKGVIEHGVVDDDGGEVICFCRTKEFADEIAKRLNGEPKKNET